jgi:hypothetical protein
MKRSPRKFLLAFCLSASMFSASGANAETIEPNPDPVPLVNTVGNDCLEVLVVSDSQSETPSQCNPAEEIVTGEEEIASQEEVAALTAMSIPQLQSITPLAATIYTKTYSFKFPNTGGSYDVVISGRFYYDYSRVWVTQLYSGKRGTLQCFVDSAFGMDLTNTACTDTGTPYVRTLTGRFHAVIFSGSGSFDSIFSGYVDATGYAYKK